MGWMSKLFGTEEEIGPEEAHRRSAEGERGAKKAPAKKAPAKKAASGEHEPAAKKSVPAPRAAHSHEPVQSGSPTHPTVSKGTGKTLEHDQMLTVHVLTH